MRRSIAILTPLSPLEPVFGPVIEEAGFRLVRLRLLGGGHKTLQVMAERADGHMDVDDCAALSRVLTDFIAAQDPLPGEYEIEVSSPGIDRPLTRLVDFNRFKGHEAKIELAAPWCGRKRLRGVLEGIDGTDVVIACQGVRGQFPFAAIAEAKLVLTEKLIQDDLR
ncbi:MAG: ribosome maturation factor RimP, partial [Rhizomicrobium sp.]